MNKKQLFLLHFAGGNCYSFNFLKNHLQHTFEVHMLELPGRGRRFGEELIRDKTKAIEDYYQQIIRLRNTAPYIVYGHSMGATLGLSITKRLEEKNDAPKRLVVSGNPGPGIKKKEDWYLSSEHEFKSKLMELGGIPKEVLENEELFNFFSPIMRADFEVLEKNQDLDTNFVIETPIYALMGDQEKDFEKIDNWNRFTNGSFQSKIFPGNHFFIHDCPEKLSQLIIANYG